MSSSIDLYLASLKAAMKKADPALIQDAQADAREHFTQALAETLASNPTLTEETAMQKLIEDYGTPEETAAAYNEIERRTTVALKPAPGSTSLLGKIFNVYIDPRTWGSLLYMTIAFVTGIVYFTWVVTGVSLSVSMLILIIGLPLAILFLLSVQGLALLEGRLVEALLGVRMPRRPAFAQAGLGWLDRLKALLSDRHTWISMLYMVFQLPLGTLYFVINVTLFSLSLSFLATPIAYLFMQGISFEIGPNAISALNLKNALILLPILGLALLTLTMHLARAIGQLHARYAKWLLVD